MGYSKFFKSIAAAGALALAFLFTSKDSNLDDSNLQPQYKTYPSLDSKYTLVHIRQRHHRWNNEDTIEEKRKTIKVQEEIYKILERFIKIGVTNFYGESITDVSKEDYLNDLSAMRKKLILDNPTREKVLYKHGAESLLALEGKASLRESESFISHLEASLIILAPHFSYEARSNRDENPKEFMQRVLFNQREDDLLEIIANNYPQETNQMHVVIYGAEHDWTDNTLRWNTRNPDKKFSLTVITTPALFKEDLEEKGR